MVLFAICYSPLFRLGLIPQRIHLSERRVLRRLAFCGERTLDRGKAALEFLVGPPQQRLRVGVQVAGEVYGGEQQIADFGRRISSAWPVAVQRGLDLVGFLANLA